MTVHYSIEIDYPNGDGEIIPLTAKTDNGARRQYAVWLRRYKLAGGKGRSKIAWFRPVDHCHGTL